jgi:hypothetical protein
MAEAAESASSGSESKDLSKSKFNVPLGDLIWSRRANDWPQRNKNWKEHGGSGGDVRWGVGASDGRMDVDDRCGSAASALMMMSLLVWTTGLVRSGGRRSMEVQEEEEKLCWGPWGWLTHAQQKRKRLKRLKKIQKKTIKSRIKKMGMLWWKFVEPEHPWSENGHLWLRLILCPSILKFSGSTNLTQFDWKLVQSWVIS